MNIDKLKQKILDLAIRGKLVPQDPNDEPASVLIDRIREEKKKLIKHGKIKAEKEESYIYKGSDNCYYEKIGNKEYCINDEIPFDIPFSWLWIRLGNLGVFRKGPFGSSLTKEIFVEESFPNRYKVYEQKNIINKNAFLGKYYITNEKFKTMKSFETKPGDILVSCAGTIGETFVLPNEAEIGIINQALMRIRLYSKEIEKFFLIYFDFILKKEAREKGNGTGMKNIPPFNVLKSMLIPMPPIEEQNRIINNLRKILKQIDFIYQNNKELSNLTYTLKSKILDYIFGENSSYKSYYEKEYTLDELLPYEQPAKYIVKNTDYNNKYKTPVITPGKSFILGYTNEKDGIYKVKNKVIIFDDFTTNSRLVNFDFKVKSSALKILKSSNEKLFNVEYLFYLLQTIKVINNTHKRYWISEYAPKKLKIHTFDEQAKIVKNINKIFSILNCCD